MTPWFEETQRARDNSWLVTFVIVVSLAPLTFVYVGLYKQLFLHEPWGNKPMSDIGLLAFTLFMTLVSALAVFVFVSMQLQTKIDREGVHYQMFPLLWRRRTVTASEIQGYTLGERFKAFEGRGIGRHRSLLRKVTSYKISGGKHLELRLKNGQRILLGTQNKEGLELAMRKLFNQTNDY